MKIIRSLKDKLIHSPLIELGKKLEKIIPPRFAYITYDIYHQRKFGDHGGNCISEAIEVGCLCEECKNLPGLC